MPVLGSWRSKVLVGATGSIPVECGQVSAARVRGCELVRLCAFLFAASMSATWVSRCPGGATCCVLGSWPVSVGPVWDGEGVSRGDMERVWLSQRSGAVCVSGLRLGLPALRAAMVIFSGACIPACREKFEPVTTRASAGVTSWVG